MRPSPYFLPTLVAYFRERTRMWAVAGLWGGLLLFAFNLYAATTTYVPQYLVRNDFRLIYGAALDGWNNGYAHLYDLAAQKAAVESLGPGAYWSPFLNPPTLAWIATPFLAIPFEAAPFLSTLLIAAPALLASRRVAVWRGAGRRAPARRYAIAGPRGLGPQVYVVQATVVGVTLVAAWRQRRLGPARPIATGIVASLLFTPYVGFQGFAMLVVAGWLLVRSGASSFQVALIVVGYALLELALLVLAVPILLAEALLLLSLAWPATHAPGDLRGLSGATVPKVSSRGW